MSRVVPAIAVFVVLASACGKRGEAGDPNSCESIGAHYLAVVQAEIAKAEGDDKKNAKAMQSLLPKMKTQMVADCTKNKWPEKTRKCLASAKSASAGKTCWESAPAANAKAVPPKSGEPETDKVVPKAAQPDPGM